MKQPSPRARTPVVAGADRRPAPPPSPAPPPVAQAPYAARFDWRRATSAAVPNWVLAPLRLFLGVTFLYAGIQKLTDPQFFNTHAPGYIGRQIQAFAVGSPLRGLLLGGVAPHASLWGAVIAWGEIAIGLGALVGLLARPAAFFGALLSLIFFLSASWRVRPYFYGADIVFFFGWVTLLLAGPLAGALPALDSWLAPALLRRALPGWREQAARALALALGVAPDAPTAQAALPGGAARAGQDAERAAAPAIRSRAGTRAARGRGVQTRASRREFITGALAGGGAMLVVSWLWSVTHPAPAASPGGTGSTGTGGGASASPTTAGEIAQVQDVPVNSASTFTIPSNGDPGVLVRLDSGKFVAFDATCTHAGCPVDYDPSSKLLLCPCHGAAFDPAQGAAVVQGPADTPLTSVSVAVNQSSGAITLQ